MSAGGNALRGTAPTRRSRRTSSSAAVANGGLAPNVDIAPTAAGGGRAPLTVLTPAPTVAETPLPVSAATAATGLKPAPASSLSSCGIGMGHACGEDGCPLAVQSPGGDAGLPDRGGHAWGGGGGSVGVQPDEGGPPLVSSPAWPCAGVGDGSGDATASTNGASRSVGGVTGTASAPVEGRPPPPPADVAPHAPRPSSASRHPGGAISMWWWWWWWCSCRCSCCALTPPDGRPLLSRMRDRRAVSSASSTEHTSRTCASAIGSCPYGGGFGACRPSP